MPATSSLSLAEIATVMKALNDWACFNKIPLVLFGIHNSDIIALDHTKCEGIPNNSDAIIQRVVNAMKNELANVCKELNKEIEVHQIVNEPIIEH